MDDFKAIAGTWRLISYRSLGREGKPEHEEFVDISAADLSVGASRFVKREVVGRRVHERKEKYRLRPETKPPEIDLYTANPPTTAEGIYSVSEDKLTICRANSGAPRPKSFTESRDDVHVYVYERADPLDAANKGKRASRKKQAVDQDMIAASPLAEYLQGKARKARTPSESSPETEWLRMCNLELTGNQLWAGDPSLPFADDGCVVQVPSGTYVVEAKCMTVDGEKTISRLRIRLDSSGNPTLGPEIGETGTDSCAIAVCDPALLEAMRAAEIDEQVVGQCGVIRLESPQAGIVPYVSTGSDGTGPVFDLLANGHRVGFELEFIPDTTET